MKKKNTFVKKKPSKIIIQAVQQMLFLLKQGLH